MTIFISHSAKDAAVYSALCLALDSAGIHRWDVLQMSLGDSLSGQLREAIDSCDLCVFIATRRSIVSQWCLAELGAFWGAGKTVILFLADPELEESVLPPQFRGNLMANDAHQLIAALQAEQHASNESSGRNRYKFFSASGDFGTESDWVRLINETKQGFDLVGVSLNSWRRTKNFGAKIREKAIANCKVRILCMHAENKLLEGLLYSETHLNSVQHAIEESRDYFQQLAAQHPNIEFRQLTTGMPHFFLTRTDANAVIIQYLSSQTWGAGPTWLCPVGSDYYGIAQAEFEKLWDSAKPTVQELLPDND